MKRVFYHLQRVFAKHWFIILIASTVSILLGLAVLILMTALSMAFASDPVEEKDPRDYFTEEELRFINSDEAADDETYLRLLAKYQTYECPKKVDPITTWTSSELTKDSFILNYEIDDKWRKYGKIDMNKVRDNILATIDKAGYKVQRIVATNRNMVFRYWNCQEHSYSTIVLSNEELKS
jgi:hypothetical protein